MEYKDVARGSFFRVKHDPWREVFLKTRVNYVFMGQMGDDTICGDNQDSLWSDCELECLTNEEVALFFSNKQQPKPEVAIKYLAAGTRFSLNGREFSMYYNDQLDKYFGLDGTYLVCFGENTMVRIIE